MAKRMAERRAKRLVPILLALLLAPLVASAGTVEYEAVFEGIWSPEHATLPFPGGAHFTSLIGDTHVPGAALWEEGGLASVGVEWVAEIGATAQLEAEIEARIANEMALDDVRTASLSGFPAEASGTFLADVSHSEVSVLSMVAPSPDWFVGASGLSLRHELGWIDELSIDLVAYDAGTETGDTFSLVNPANDPHQAISHRGSPFVEGVVIARLHFTRIPEPGPTVLAATALLCLGFLARGASRRVR